MKKISCSKNRIGLSAIIKGKYTCPECENTEFEKVNSKDFDRVYSCTKCKKTYLLEE